MVEARLSFGLGTILGCDMPALHSALNKRDIGWAKFAGATHGRRECGLCRLRSDAKLPEFLGPNWREAWIGARAEVLIGE